MATKREYDIGGLSLTDDTYTVTQSLVRNKYTARDSAGNVVLRGKQKAFRAREQFPFVDGDGNDVFTVKATSIVDVAGNYVLTDARSGEDLVVLDNDFSLFRDTWRVRDAGDGTVLATIRSRGLLTSLARHYLPLGGLIPHRYEITDADGDHVGSIDGKLSLRDRYEVRVDDASDVPREPVVAAAMVVDAIQDN